MWKIINFINFWKPDFKSLSHNSVLHIKLKNSKKTLSQCHFVHHKSHTDWPGCKPRSLWWKAKNPRNGTAQKLNLICKWLMRTDRAITLHAFPLLSLCVAQRLFIDVKQFDAPIFPACRRSWHGGTRHWRTTERRWTESSCWNPTRNAFQRSWKKSERWPDASSWTAQIFIC
jgi:hypothetical protein